jgi:hypothetical protein
MSDDVTYETCPFCGDQMKVTHYLDLNGKDVRYYECTDRFECGYTFHSNEQV